MRAGTAAREITPGRSMPMAGFDRRKEPASGTLDPLYVSALALEDAGGAAVIFLGFDLLGVDVQLSNAVKQAVGKALALDTAQVWVSATHTHSGPTLHSPAKNDAEREYTAMLLRQTAEAAAEAMTALEPVQPFFAMEKVTGVTSLRNRGREGSAFPMPLPVTRLDGGEKSYHLVRICCHPTVLDQRSTVYSSDLPGQMRRLLGRQRPCLILNGACGDLSTRFTRTASDPAELERLGGLLGAAVAQAACTAAPTFGERIRCVEKTVYLDRAASMEPEKREALLRTLREKAAACTDPQAFREYDARIAVLERPPVAAQSAWETHIHAVDLGAHILLGIPFEMDHGDSLVMEKDMSAAAGKPVYVVCYTGGADGYLPSGRPLTAESSYEDIASRCLPQARQQLWRCAEACVTALAQQG